MKNKIHCNIFTAIVCVLTISILADETAYPHPVTNPASPLMLTGEWLPEDHHEIDFSSLPQIPIRHIVINNVSAENGVNQHNYMVHHNGLFWAMWSDGPSIEDKAGQVVKYSTSRDGVNWSTSRMMTPYPPDSEPGSEFYNTRDGGWRYISRGFWVRDGKLLALASLDEAKWFFGPSLALHAFEWQESAQEWSDIGVVKTNAINNFPPKLLPSGEWAMSRRKYNYASSGVQFLIGGVSALTEWESFPIVTDSSSALKAEEPLWWNLPDNSQVALFRDNGGGHYLYRSFSTDNGRSWSTPVQTDFPDATSKIFGMRLSDGRYALVSNPNPLKRDPMTLALSDDGLVFNRMFYLTGGRHVDYPHMIEHNGYLYIAHSGAKQSVEIERISLADLNALAPKEEIIAYYPFTGSTLTNTAAHPRVSATTMVTTNTGALGFNSTTISPESGVPVMTVTGLTGGKPERYTSFNLDISNNTALTHPSVQLYAKAGSSTGTIQVDLVTNGISYQMGMREIDATLRKYTFTLPEGIYPEIIGSCQIRIYGWDFATAITTLRIDDLTVKAAVKELPSKSTVLTISQFSK